MSELLITSLLVATAAAVIILYRSVGNLKFPVLRKATSNSDINVSEHPDQKVLNCRVRFEKQKKDKKADPVFDSFTVEIRGSIHAPTDNHYTSVQISITDITDGIDTAKPVRSSIEKWQTQDSPGFSYNCDLGKLPNTDTTLSDWMTITNLHLDWLMFPRKGTRNLQFTTSILSRQTDDVLACAKCNFTHENLEPGYLDLQDNIQRTKTLAVALAFALSAADNKLYTCQIELIKKWARDNIAFSRASDKAKRKLEKAMNKTVDFFCDGNHLDIRQICEEIVEIAPLAHRYDILDLCLHVAGANGIATSEEIALLKNLATWLEVDIDRFREMTERILPADMHETKDMEIILGVTSDMTKEQTRLRLNTEYRKWNARVTNTDPEIQSQADHMLNFIAEARNSYIA